MTIAHPPCIIAMNNFSQHKIDDDSWFSPPFYTAPNGYKAQLRIDAVGHSSAKGTHISASVYLMKSQNDDKLKWPFKGFINLQLLNSKEDQNHVERIFSHNMAPSFCLDRVSIGDRAAGGMYYQQFIAHSNLHHNIDRSTHYLCDDTLYFKVSKVTMLTGNIIIYYRTQFVNHYNKFNL